MNDFILWNLEIRGLGEGGGVERKVFALYIFAVHTHFALYDCTM